MWVKKLLCTRLGLSTWLDFIYIHCNPSQFKLWSSNDQNNVMSSSVVNHLSLPLFSLTPQEYITKIGQYLLTLPQNFEPFAMQDNAQLIIALKYGKLPYLDEKGTQTITVHLLECWTCRKSTWITWMILNNTNVSDYWFMRYLEDKDNLFLCFFSSNFIIV